ncbi:MAG: sugar ABC transporter substrate-binding protein [Spirochaetales bacterium]|nr:sugar ABC transporter substrate-binding protein [Spirochaetales bacterium]
MKKILLVLMALVMTGMVFAAGQQEAAPVDTSGKTVVKMGLAMQSKMAPAFHAWEDYLYARVQIEAEERGYVVDWSATNANGDSTKQANDIKDLLAKGSEVVFVPCNDSQAILQSVEEVHNAGALYVSYCRAVSPEAAGNQVPDTTINFSSEEQAYVGVMKMFEIMEADGIVPTTMIDVHGQVIDENAINREKGLRRALVDAGYPDLKVVVCDSGAWEPDVARDSVDAALQAHPEANCLYTSSDFMMPGIQTALENNDKWYPRGEEGHVYIASSDIFPIAIEMLQAGYITTAVDQGCYEFAVNAAKSAFDLLEGKEVEKMQLTLGTMATVDNIDEILADDSIFLWGNDYK